MPSTAAPATPAKKRSAADLVGSASRKKRKGNAAKWRQTWGRLEKPVVTSQSSYTDKVIARLWRGPARKGEHKQSKCWTCFVSNKDMPIPEVDGTEKDELLGCGCLAQNALIEECLVLFHIFNAKQKTAVKADESGFTKAAGKQIFQWVEFVKMMFCDFDEAGDWKFDIEEFFDFLVSRGWPFDGI